MAIARIPNSAAAGAEIEMTSATSVTEGIGGRSGRVTNRQIPIRNFHLTTGPETTQEVAALFYTHRRMWPVAVRDWSNYTFTDALLVPNDDGDWPLRFQYAPATGSRFLHQRVLVPDESEADVVISVDGSPISRGSWTLADFGIAQISGAGSSSVVRATGHYLVPACFASDQLTMKVYTIGSEGPILGINDLQLREILEDELIDLMARTDDSM